VRNYAFTPNQDALVAQFDHAVLADNDAGKLGFDLFDGVAEPGDGTVLFVVHSGRIS